ncbi:MAG: SIMPL domain-containing protein [Chloroflexi bacterium]|nr:SIMPL domain-containing protein [Chloroflexota bacterium]MDA1147989.1 SIMPL domain-containing protein [Chloroflexota bacterium]
MNEPAAQITLSGQQSSGIAVSGSGRVAVTPDIARLDVGVEVTGDTVARARGDAASAMESIMSALVENGVAEADVQTRYFNIYPQYRYRDETAPEIIGFTVTNQVTVTVRNIDNASAVLDAAIEAGGDAVRVNGITFTVENPQEFLDEARADAIKDARARAETIADAAGVDLGSVRSISESTSFVDEQRFAAPAAADTGGGTSISAGQQELTVSVSVIFEVK